MASYLGTGASNPGDVATLGKVGVGTTSPNSNGVEIRTTRTGASPYYGQLYVVGNGDHAYVQIETTDKTNKETGIQLIGSGSTGYPDWAVKIGANSHDLKFTAFQGTFYDRVTLTQAGKVGIGTTTPQGTLDVSGTTGGLVVPRMTSAQEGSLSGVVDGTIIYNTSTGKFRGRASGGWTDLN